MQADPWKPEQYRLFERERKQPALDLIALVRTKPAMRVIDLGCGTGELTRELHEHLQAVGTLGIDSSEKMLTESAQFADATLTFQRAPIESFAPQEKFDLVFSNAALQWVPGHESILQRFA